MTTALETQPTELHESTLTLFRRAFGSVENFDYQTSLLLDLALQNLSIATIEQLAGAGIRHVSQYAATRLGTLDFERVSKAVGGEADAYEYEGKFYVECINRVIVPVGERSPLKTTAGEAVAKTKGGEFVTFEFTATLVSFDADDAVYAVEVPDRSWSSY